MLCELNCMKAIEKGIIKTVTPKYCRNTCQNKDCNVYQVFTLTRKERLKK